MRTVLDALDAEPVSVTGVLDQRADRAQVEQAMGTVAELMRPPNDPFHERLVAAYPQIRRFGSTTVDEFLMSTDADR